MTKGDNNQIEDTLLYPPGREFASRHEVIGLVRGYVPFLGWAVIALQEWAWVKFIAFACVLIATWMS